MMKKIYQTPSVRVHFFAIEQKICLTSPVVTNVVSDTDTGITNGGAGDGTSKNGGSPRVKRHSIWDGMDE